jgi:hypothetical protein
MPILLNCMFRSLRIIAIGLLVSSAAYAQSAYTPEKGSPERTAILNALRIPVERDLKQKVVFVTENFKVQGPWAFVSGTPRGANGGSPDYSGTQYEEAKKEGFFDNNFFALLKKTNGKWKVTTVAIGCTDVCFSDWWKRYKAPKGIFPYTE